MRNAARRCRRPAGARRLPALWQHRSACEPVCKEPMHWRGAARGMHALGRWHLAAYMSSCSRLPGPPWSQHVWAEEAICRGLLCQASGEPVAAAALAAWAVVGETLDTLEPYRCGPVVLSMVACCIRLHLLCFVKQRFPGLVHPQLHIVSTWPNSNM